MQNMTRKKLLSNNIISININILNLIYSINNNGFLIIK